MKSTLPLPYLISGTSKPQLLVLSFSLLPYPWLSHALKIKLGISSHVNRNHYNLILSVCCSNSKYHFDQTQEALPLIHYLGVTQNHNRKRNCSYLGLLSLQSCGDWCIHANNMTNISHFLAKRAGFWCGCHTQKKDCCLHFQHKIL